MLQQQLGQVRSIDIVRKLDYSKPSVSVAMKRLREGGYIEVDGEGHITLLPPGLEIARRTYDRHRLLTRFLTGLGVGEETAAEDACRIEHHISEETFRCIRAALEQK